MSEFNRPEDEHLSAEAIADYIVGASGEIEAAAAAIHIEKCESCRGVYEYASRFVRNHPRGPAFTRPGRKAQRAASIVTREKYKKEHFDRRGRRWWLTRVGRRGRVAVSVGGAVLFAAAVFWLRPYPTNCRYTAETTTPGVTRPTLYSVDWKKEGSTVFIDSGFEGVEFLRKLSLFPVQAEHVEKYGDPHHSVSNK